MIHTRPYRREDDAFLWEMLYQSLHVRGCEAPLPRSVLEQPDIAHDLTEFCRNGDGAVKGSAAAACRSCPSA